MNLWFPRLFCVVLALAISSAAALADEKLPGYEPQERAAGTISVSGDAADRALIESLQSAFVRYQPSIEFRNSLHGPESTLAGVYVGTADLAFMAREIREPLERMAFEWVTLAKPYGVKYANAGFEKSRPGTQLAVFVHAENPVESLSLAQLDAIFGAEHKRGDNNIRNWGEVNAGGAIRGREIRVFGPRLDSISTLFFRRTVMLDSRKWNPGYDEFDSAGDALHALSGDVAGIALAPLAYRRPGVKALSIATDESKEAIALTRQTAISNAYPLHRSVAVILHRPEKGILAPRVREFLRFVLSTEGQRVIELNGTYLPLSRASAVNERKRLQ